MGFLFIIHVTIRALHLHWVSTIWIFVRRQEQKKEDSLEVIFSSCKNSSWTIHVDIQPNLIRASYFNCTGPCIWSESQCISCFIRFWIISAQSISTLFSLVSVCHNSLLEDRPPLLPALTAGWTLSSKLCIVCRLCRRTLQLITWFNIEIKIDQHQVVRSGTIRLAPWTLHDPCFISVVTSGHQEPDTGQGEDF